MSFPAQRAQPALAGRSYLLRTCAFMGIYVLLNLAAILGVFDGVVGRPAGWVLAVAVAAPVAAQVWATLRLMAGCDEYVRALIARGFILAAGTTLALWTAWGFGETYAAAAHAPGWLIYPCFMALFGLMTPLMRMSR
ncbi:hypothetical protein [Bordetella trematum]|uniref:hypothetical protein n=1 Tax=Bordetella trematum TaxID=123899 RepID=UPI0039896324